MNIIKKSPKAFAPPHPLQLQNALAYTAKRFGYSVSVLGRHIVVSPWLIECSDVLTVSKELHKTAQVILGDLTLISATDKPQRRVNFQFRIERAQPKGQADTLEFSIFAPVVPDGH